MRTFSVAVSVTLVACTAMTVAGRGVHAQSSTTPVDATITFEAASVKANHSGDARMSIGSPRGRFTVTNVPVRELIRIAYGVQLFQLVGGPSWIETERYDINAKSPADAAPMGPPGSGASDSPIAIMMRNLLAERFKLKTHREQREMPIFVLTVARQDGKLGPNLKPSATDCKALRAAPRAGGPPPQFGPPPPGEAPQCGMFMGIASIAGGGLPLSMLTTTLGQRLGRTVVDRTGLKGDYDFVLNFTPDQLPPGANAAPGQPPLLNGAPVDLNGPTLVTALQEQLGLKLDSQRGPVDVIVIDSVDHPVED